MNKVNIKHIHNQKNKLKVKSSFKKLSISFLLSIALFFANGAIPTSLDFLAPQTRAQEEGTALVVEDLPQFEDISYGLANFNNEEDVNRMRRLMIGNPKLVNFMKAFFVQKEFQQKYGNTVFKPEWLEFLKTHDNPQVLTDFMIGNILKEIGYVFFYRHKSETYGDFVMVQPVIDPESRTNRPTDVKNRTFYMLPTFIDPDVNITSSSVRIEKEFNPILNLQKGLVSKAMMVLALLSAKSKNASVQVVAPKFSPMHSFFEGFSNPEAFRRAKQMGQFQVSENYSVTMYDSSSKEAPLLQTPFNLAEKGKSVLTYLVDVKKGVAIKVDELKSKKPTPVNSSAESDEAELVEIFSDIKTTITPESAEFFENPDIRGESLTGEALRQKLIEASDWYLKKEKVGPYNLQLMSVAVPTELHSTFKANGGGSDTLTKRRNKVTGIQIERNVPIINITEPIKTTDGESNNLRLPNNVTNWLRTEMGPLLEENPGLFADLLGLAQFILAFPEGGKLFPNVISSAEGLAEFVFRYSILSPEQQQDTNMVLSILQEVDKSISSNEITPIEDDTAYIRLVRMMFRGYEPDSISLGIVPRNLPEKEFNKIVDEIYDIMEQANTWFIPYPTKPVITESRRHLLKDLPIEFQVDDSYEVFPDTTFDFVHKFLGTPLVNNYGTDRESLVTNPLREMIASTLRDVGEQQYFVVRGAKTTSADTKEEEKIISANVFQMFFRKWPDQATEDMARNYILKHEDGEDLTEDEYKERLAELKLTINTTVYSGLMSWDKKSSPLAFLHMMMSFFRASLGGLEPSTGQDIYAGTAGAGEPASKAFISTTVKFIEMITEQSEDVGFPIAEFIDPVPVETSFDNPVFEKLGENHRAVNLTEPYIHEGVEQKIAYILIKRETFESLGKFLDPEAELAGEKLHLGARIQRNADGSLSALVKHRTVGKSFLYQPSKNTKLAKYFSRILAAMLRGIPDRHGDPHVIRGLKSSIIKMFLAHKIFGNTRHLDLPPVEEFRAVFGPALTAVLKGDLGVLRSPIHKRLGSVLNKMVLESRGTDNETPLFTSNASGFNDALNPFYSVTGTSSIHFGVRGLENLDVMWNLRSEGAFLFDNNNKMSNLWKVVERILNIQDINNQNIGSAIADAIEEEFEGQDVQFDRNVFLKSDWLQSQNGIEHIQKLFRSQSVIFRIVDLANEQDLEKIRQAFSDVEIQIGSLYVGELNSLADPSRVVKNIGNQLSGILNQSGTVIELVDNKGRLGFEARSPQSTPWIEGSGTLLLANSPTAEAA